MRQERPVIRSGARPAKPRQCDCTISNVAPLEENPNETLAISVFAADRHAHAGPGGLRWWRHGWRDGRRNGRRSRGSGRWGRRGGRRSGRDRRRAGHGSRGRSQWVLQPGRAGQLHPPDRCCPRRAGRRTVEPVPGAELRRYDPVRQGRPVHLLLLQRRRQQPVARRGL